MILCGQELNNLQALKKCKHYENVKKIDTVVLVK